MNEIKQIILTSLTSTAVIGFLAYLFRTWLLEKVKSSIKLGYEKDLANHKADLDLRVKIKLAEIKLAADFDLQKHKVDIESQSTKEIEQLKANLQVAATERNIRLTRAFDMTVETISGVYSRLIDVRNSVQNYTSIMSAKKRDEDDWQERRNEVADAMTEMGKFYQARKPFLPHHVTERIDDIINQLDENRWAFLFEIEHGGAKEDYVNRWFEISDSVNTGLAPLLVDLDNDLRKILCTLDVQTEDGNIAHSPVFSRSH